jgi:hypothetical protein
MNWGATLAVKVTDCPLLMGFAEVLKLVVVEAAFTTCPTVPELPEKVESPP